MPIASTYEPIQTQTLGSNQVYVDLTVIPQTYTDLVLVATVKWTGSGASSWGLSFNSDFGNNYGVVRFYGGGGSITASGESPYPATQTGQINSSNWTDNITQINGYTNTNFHKLALTRANIATGSVTGLFEGRWSNTAAISSIRCGNFDSGIGAFAAGSVFTLYGIKAA